MKIKIVLVFFFLIIMFYCFSDKIKEYFSFINIDLPGGSWKRDCTVTSYRYPILWATCNDDKGRPVDTSIDLSSCPEIEHRDPDYSDPSHKYMDKTILKPEYLSKKLPHQHKLRVENGELKCEYY